MRGLLVLLVVAGAGAILLLRSGDGPLGPAPAPAPQERERDRSAPERRERDRPEVRCPSGATGCRAVAGRIVFVERVDPDGDGDLHVVLAAGGVSAPGVTSVDVRPGLRPRRDPRLGERASAAGPVQRGSIGQPQIHALRFRVHR